MVISIEVWVQMERCIATDNLFSVVSLIADSR